MDVNFSIRLMSAALATLATASIANAVAAAEGGVSTIAISTDADGSATAPVSVAAGSQLVVRTADLDADISDAVVAEDPSAAPAKPTLGRELGAERQAVGAIGQGQLTVVANQHRRAQTTTVVTDRDVAPAIAEEELTLPASSGTPGAGAHVDRASALFVRAHRLSLAAESEADYSQIIRWCAEGLRHEPQGEAREFAVELSAWALTQRGQLRTDAGDAELALADFTAALVLAPNYWRALHHRGVTRAQSGQFAEAFDDVCRVIQLNPKFAKAYSNRATLYAQAGDLDRARADYQEALRLDPALTPALVGYARACHLAGDRDEALASFNGAIEQAPQDAEVFCSRGDLLADLGRYDESLADYAAAIDLDPQFEHAYRNGAWLLATCPDESVRNVEGALAGAQKSLQCGYGHRHAALDTLAAAQANAGQFEEAVTTIAQAIDVAPAAAKAAYEARRQLYQSGRPFRTQPVAQVQAAEFVEDGAVVASDDESESVNKLPAGFIETF
jgi:tetratricopeptide (TPR) repeat protein